MEKIYRNGRYIFINPDEKNKFRNFVRELKSINPYYKEILAKYKMEEMKFEELYFSMPIITKKIMNSNRDKFLSNVDKRIYHEFTSGSTGEPLICYKTMEERMVYARILWQLRKNLDSKVEKTNFFSVFGTVNTEGIIDFTDTHDTNMNRIIQLLKEKKVRWLSGSVSILLQYSKYVQKHNIELPSLKYVELQAEYASKDDRRNIESALKAQTIIHYGMREVWTLGYECEKGEVHLLNSGFIYEIEEDTECLYITSLKAKCLPFIRYKTGDRVKIENARCDCEQKDFTFKIFKGREANLIYGYSGLVGDIVVKRVVHRALCHYDKNADVIRKYRVEQMDTNFFLFYVEKGIDYNKEVEKLIIERMEFYLGNKCKIEFIYQIVDGDRNGKIALFRNRIVTT